MFFVKVFFTLLVVNFSLGEDEAEGVFQRSNASRILNGEILDIENVPYYASFFLPPNYRHVCGGAIIHVKWILSAAQCFVSIKIFLRVK